MNRRFSSNKRTAQPSKPSRKSPTTWRLFGIQVHPDDAQIDAQHHGNCGNPISKVYLSSGVLKELCSRLRLPNHFLDNTAAREQLILPKELLDVRVVRRSLDARRRRDKGPFFTFVLDVDVAPGVRISRLKEQPGRCEKLEKSSKVAIQQTSGTEEQKKPKPRVVIVGAGPAGLFCALQLARSGQAIPVVLERGQPVETRGKDIGALMHRRSLHSESNFCFGEGGAGTWSDGKLTTRIGRNSDSVRVVLETLVSYGAPDSILVDGSPHLGTNNLVRLIRSMRMDLRRLGGEVRFGSRMTGLIVSDCGKQVKGVRARIDRVVERGTGIKVQERSSEEQMVYGDAVVLATGHSARDVYENLHNAGVKLEAKGFAAGFRVEHPQSYINEIQYGCEWGPTVLTGKKRTDDANRQHFASCPASQQQHTAHLPVPSYRLATDRAFDGKVHRGVYSFCMCPGGQIVPASTDPNEVCVNGMSFSRRDSLWANSALVVTVSPQDEILDPYRKEHGVFAGLAFQKDMEQRAAAMGGGNLTVPVQRLTDFIKGVPSTTAPFSSYRLGVRPSACHEIYPGPLVAAFRDALTNHFEKQMPGYVCQDGLLHAVETRTSSPLRISRDKKTMQCFGQEGLFPAGEGAGFAGGIVSAAVDGMQVAESVLDFLEEKSGSGERVSGRPKVQSSSLGFNY